MSRKSPVKRKSPIKSKLKKDGLSPLRSHSPARRSTLGKMQSPNKRSKIQLECF